MLGSRHSDTRTCSCGSPFVKSNLGCLPTARDWLITWASPLQTFRVPPTRYWTPNEASLNARGVHGDATFVTPSFRIQERPPYKGRTTTAVWHVSSSINGTSSTQRQVRRACTERGIAFRPLFRLRTAPSGSRSGPSLFRRRGSALDGRPDRALAARWFCTRPSPTDSADESGTRPAD